MSDWYWRSYGDFFSQGTDKQHDFWILLGNMPGHKKIQLKAQN